MVLQVNQEMCAGCGLCMEACPIGAIQLVDRRAEINDALCTQCEACVDACPNGAITTILEPAQLMPIVTETLTIPVPTRTPLPAAEPSNRSLASIAGAALAFLGREFAPRLVDVLITTLEHRLERPTTTAVTPLPTSSRALAVQCKGKRRQARYRGRHSN